MVINLLTFLFAWYNLPFTLLLGLCLVLAMLQLVGLGGDQDSDHDVDHNLDHDFDHDADHDVDQDADHDTDHDADSDADSDPVSVARLLAFVGVGKAPLLVVLLILCSSIGITGWILNGLAQGLTGGVYVGFAFILVLPLAVGAGAVVSARVARLIGRALPPLSTTASRAQEFVGRVGTVTSPFVDEKYGQVHLRATDQTLINVFAVTDPGETFKRGDSVVLVAYDAQRKIYTVTRAPEL